MYFAEVSFFIIIPMHRNALVSFWQEFKNFIAVGKELPCTQPFTNINFHFVVIVKTATSQVLFRQSKQNNNMTGNIRIIGWTVFESLVKRMQQFLYPTCRMVTPRNGCQVFLANNLTQPRVAIGSRTDYLTRGINSTRMASST